LERLALLIATTTIAWAEQANGHGKRFLSYTAINSNIDKMYTALRFKRLGSD
jgi:hypothetical protein